MIAVLEIKHLFESECLCHGIIVPLIVRYRFAHRATAVFLVIGSPDQISRVPFANELCDGSPGKEGYVIGMWLDGGQDFTRVRLAVSWTFNHNLRCACGSRKFARNRV